MSNTVMGMAWYTGGLSPAQKSVLVAMADHASDEGEHIFPSVKRLSIKTSLAERTVRRALGDLREMNLIRVVREAKYHHATEYALDLPEMQARSLRPAIEAPHDLPESPTDLPESPTDLPESAPQPSLTINNHHVEPSKSASKLPGLPTSLQCPEFEAAWQDFQQHRKEIRKKLTPLAAQRQLTKLEQLGPERAVAAIEHSIAQGWTGIYEPSENGRRAKSEPAGFAAIRRALEQ